MLSLIERRFFEDDPGDTGGDTPTEIETLDGPGEITIEEPLA